MNKSQRLNVLRIGLGVLILANLFMIFSFSSQDAAESGLVSKGVSYTIARIFVADFEELPPTEQSQIIVSIHPYVRKLAHMAEFGLLGALTFSLLLTWKNRLSLQYAEALLGVLAVACIDELSQGCSTGRASQFTDVLIDLSGALLTCSLILLIVILCRRHRMKGRFV